MTSQASATVSGPPYAPQTALLGGTPSNAVDTPITAVFIAIFLACAVANIVIFQTNRKRGHKFLLSILVIGFSMARVLTSVLRIVWANRLDNISVGIAATLFNNVGVFLLYIINLLLAQRILRAKRPSIGWSRMLRLILIIAYSLIAVVVVLVITFTVLSYYTRDMSLLTAARDVQLASSTYLMLFVTLPYVLLAIAYLPGSDSAHHESFGHGTLELKTVMLLVMTTLVTLEQGFKYGTAWVPAVPNTSSPWYFSKACFYCFGFMLEVLWMLVALGMRIDHKFHVPDGSSKRKTYQVVATKDVGESGSV